MPNIILNASDSIDTLLGSLRSRLEAALKDGQSVRVDAREGMKRQVWREGVTVVPEPDGSFDLVLRIEPKP